MFAPPYTSATLAPVVMLPVAKMALRFCVDVGVSEDDGEEDGDDGEEGSWLM